MELHKQAPRLYHNKEDYFVGNFYQLPQQILDKVFEQLDGKCGNQIKLMVVLLGTIGNGSFRVSQRWVQERTGLSQVSYIRARQKLVEKGWLVLDGGCLAIDISEILGDNAYSLEQPQENQE